MSGPRQITFYGTAVSASPPIPKMCSPSLSTCGQKILIVGCDFKTASTGLILSSEGAWHKAVRTDETPPARYGSDEISHVGNLKRKLQLPLMHGRAGHVSQIATTSAKIDQRHHPKGNFKRTDSPADAIAQFGHLRCTLLPVAGPLLRRELTNR